MNFFFFFQSKMKIKNYKSFLEAISGTELVGKHMGPNYPEQDNSPMKKLGITDVLYSDIYGRMVTYDEYQELYNQYKKNLGTEILLDFTPENLDRVLSYLEKIKKNESFVSWEDAEMIEDIFRSLISEGEFKIVYTKKANPLHYGIKITKDITKTDDLFFHYKDIKDEVCHFVSYLEGRYYNTFIEKRWDDGLYGINPQEYTGKYSILSSVEVIYKD